MHGLVFNENSPHQVIEINSFSRDDIKSLRTFQKMVQVSLMKRPALRFLCKSSELKYHSMFIDFREKYTKEIFDFEWSVRSGKEKRVAVKFIENFVNYLFSMKKKFFSLYNVFYLISVFLISNIPFFLIAEPSGANFVYINRKNLRENYDGSI